MDNNINNHLPPVIYVEENKDRVRNYKWDSRTKNLNKNVVVLEPSQIKALGEGTSPFVLPYDLTSGEILVRHPYLQGYILATDAEDKYLTASADGIFLIARCLGATKISYKRCNIAEFRREVDNNNNLTYKAVDVNLAVKHSMEQKLSNKISMTQEFPKQEFSTEQFNKAKSIAEERGLIMSETIRSLLDARDPNLGTPMIRQTINAEISSSLNKVMDIAFTLNTVPFFNLNSNTRIATQKKLELNIEWEILF